MLNIVIVVFLCMGVDGFGENQNYFVCWDFRMFTNYLDFLDGH